ncbi:MAG TPA: hypothetical protein VMU19_00670 [Bryobacteraceae bacterium]|nr:hypothetical protein [Bryobacteraceae bacterium]
MQIRGVLFSGILVLACVGMCPAADLGVDFTTPDYVGSYYSFNAGYSFNVLAPVDLVGLAVLAPSSDHDVAVWGPDETLIASATVTPSDPRIGAESYFSWTSVTPVLLLPGIDYRVAATTLNDFYVALTSGLFTDPNIQYNDGIAEYAPSGQLAYPDSCCIQVVAGGIFGGDIVVSDVPEPGCLAALGLGLMAVFAYARPRVRG